jgi:uncharacterized protein (DUF58 family)
MTPPLRQPPAAPPSGSLLDPAGAPGVGLAIGATERGLTPAQEARLRRLLLVMRRPVSQGLSGAFRSHVRGSGIEFEEVRPYQPGDDVRGIDWNVTARTGEPHVKTYREERQLEVQLLLDVSASMDFGSAEDTKRHKAAELAALLAAACALSRDALSADLCAAGPPQHIPKGRSQSHWARLHYAVVSHPGGAASGAEFAAAAAGLRRHLRRRHAVFVISDFLGVGDGAWEAELGSLAAIHDVNLVRITDRFEEQLPSAGLICLVDPESGLRLELDSSDPRLRRGWSERAEQRRADFERRAGSFGLPHFRLDTSESSGEALVAYLRRAARRAAGGGP